MQYTEFLLFGSIILPFFASVLNYVFRASENVRDIITLFLSALTFLFVLGIVSRYRAGEFFDLSVLTVMPGLEIAFKIEPLGLLFAVIASSLWIVTHLYAMGYMRGNKEEQ